MAGGVLLCPLCFVTLIPVLLGAGLHDMEAPSCTSPFVITKKVGDTVEFPTCLPSEELSTAEWRYERFEVVEYEKFTGRAIQNKTTNSLTLQNLTLQDSGDFQFISVIGSAKQRSTTIIRLNVQEALIEKPSLTVSSTWIASSRSCVVSLECRSSPGSNLTYRLTVRNQNYDGARLQFTLTPQEGAVRVSCNVSNSVSNKSDSASVTCSNFTQPTQEPGGCKAIHMIYLIVAAGVAVLILVAVAVNVCCSKRRPAAAASSDLGDLTVYAAIPDATAQIVRSNTLASASCVYETIDDRVNSVMAGTVYDKIQLSRLKQTPSSPDTKQHDA